MCLDTITKEIVLKEDLKIKKIVGKQPYLNKYYHGCVSMLSKPIIINDGINEAEIIKIKCMDGSYYDSGFHCYPDYISHDHILSNSKYYKILEFTVPKGTKVLYGIQDQLEVIVTPVLIYKGEDVL